MFDLFGREKINLIKKSGKKYSDIEYDNFGKDKIIIRSKVSVVKDDILEIESEKKIKYTVIDAYSDFITGKKVVEFKKITNVTPSKPKSASSNGRNGVTNSGIINHGVINQIYAGNNSQIENSITHTTNYTLTAQDKKDFEKLKKIANQLERNKTILNNIDEMKNSVGTKSFNSKYNKFIKSIANHAQLFSSIISFLDKFLQ